MTERPLKVVLDAHWLVSGPPSGRNVVSSLFPAWKAAFPQDELTLITPDGFETAAALTRLRAQGFSAAGSGWIKQHGLSVIKGWPPSLRGHDFALTQNFAPLMRSRGLPSIVFVHDLIYEEHPEWFSRKERAYLAAASYSAQRGAAVVTSSESEAARIRSRFGERLPVAAVGLGLASELRDAKAMAPNWRPTRPFVLSVGRLNIRKNLARLVDGYLDSPLHRTHDLLLVGAGDGLQGSIPLVDSRIRWLGHVPYGELRWLYEHCSAFVFASLDEGFGMPLVEAAYFGAPIAASSIPAFLELDLAQRYFDPHDARSISSSILSIIDEPLNPPDRAPTTWSDVAGRIRAFACGQVIAGRERI